ncbi:MAG TPA: hypothetical protein VLR26_10680 [Frankiaceae bacterium]|nr:hypothetical protein [Frankiaceae bacterium]
MRPDRDLSTPELRDAWKAGDLAPFHGWDRRFTPTPKQPDGQDRAVATSKGVP